MENCEKCSMEMTEEHACNTEAPATEMSMAEEPMAAPVEAPAEIPAGESEPAAM